MTPTSNCRCLPLALLLIVCLVGCGDSHPQEDSHGDEGSSSGTAADRNAGVNAAPAPTRAHHDSEAGSRQFLIPGGDNSVQRFGEEAPRAELRQAALALHGFLDARITGDWAAACEHLSSDIRRLLAGSGTAGGASTRGCAAALSAMARGVPSRTLREAAGVDVGALRTSGGRGYLLYRGVPDGRIYAIPVRRDTGGWKVAALGGAVLSR